MRSLILGGCAVGLLGCFGSSSPATPGPVIGADDASALDGATDGTTSADALADAGSPAYADAGTTSFGTGRVTSPQGIAIDPTTGAIWVASFAGGLVEFDANEAYVGTFGTSGAGQVAQGAGAAIDSRGNVYVGDYGAHDVVEFDKTGTYVATSPRPTRA